MLALLARLKSFWPVILVIAGIFAFYAQNLRIKVEVSRADAAEARSALTQAAYDSAIQALKLLEADAKARAEKTQVVIQEVEKVRYETIEKLVYIEREPTPETCPDAIQFLATFGVDFEGEPQ